MGFLPFLLLLPAAFGGVYTMVEKITLENLTTNKQIILGMLPTQSENFVLLSVDWGTAEGTHSTYKYANQIGVSIVSTSLETRAISIIGAIVSENSGVLLDCKKMLSNFVNPQQQIKILYKNYYICFNPSNSIRYGTEYKENNDVICRFKIDGIAPLPYFRTDNDLQIDAATTIPFFHFPLIIPPGGLVFGVRQPAQLVNVYNAGSLTTGFTIIFKAVGACLNPKITNARTLEYFEIDKLLTAGERVVIDTLTGEKSVIGTILGVSSNYYRYKTLGSTWLQLQPGDNVFRFDAAKNPQNIEAYIQFSNQFLEVQELD